MTHALTRGRRRDGDGRVDVLLVCDTGGHLLQLVTLRDVWGDVSRLWVTLSDDDAHSLLADEDVLYAHGPTSRDEGWRAAVDLLRNIALAWRTIARARPQIVLTTGASLAVPFTWIGRLRGARVVYVESFTRIDTASLSCRLVRPIASRVYVQWPELRAKLPRSRYAGAVFSWRSRASE